MIEWLVALGVFAAFLLVLPRLLRRPRRTARGGGGLVLGLGMFLASVFDPASKAPTEEIARRREAEPGEDESGAPPA